MAEPIISFNIDVSELTRLAAALPEMVVILSEEMEKGMEESGMLLTTMVAARTPVNYGLLRASIGYPRGFEMRGGGSILDTLRGIVGAADLTMAMGGTGTSTSKYVTYVEEGTAPHWPPAAPLKLWAIRKFGDERIGYMVQRAIARRGTKGAHMFQRAWNEGGKERVTRIWKQVPARAVKRFEAKAGA